MNRKIKIVLIGILVSLLLTIVIEVVCFNLNAIRFKDDSCSFSFVNKAESVTMIQEEALVPLTEDERNSIAMNRENARILAEMNGLEYQQEKDASLLEDGDEMFRKKISTSISIELPSDIFLQKIHLDHSGLKSDSTYEIQVYRKEKMVFQGIDGIADTRISTSVIRTDVFGDYLTIRIFTEEEPDLSAMKVSIVNGFQLNWYRMLFLFLTFMILFAFFFHTDSFVRKPEIIFGGISLLLGTLLILLIGTNQIGFDEHVHAASAYNSSFGATIETTETAMRMKANDLPMFHNVEERKMVEAYEDANNNYAQADISTQSRFITYSDRSYLPIALLVRLGRMLDLSFAWCMMLGKFGNLLCYTLLAYLAIRFAKTGKGIITALALIPNSLFAATAFTYDGVVNGFLLLAVVLTTNYILEDEAKLTWMQVLLVIGAYIAGSTAKPIYMVMAFILVFLAHKKFENRPREWLFKLSVTGIILLLVYTIFFPPVSSSSNYELIGNLAYAGDKRNQGTSVLGQLQYIMGNPFQYAWLLIRSMFSDLWNYLTGNYRFFNLGYLGSLSGIWTIFFVILLGLASVIRPEGEERPVLPKRYKLLNLGMIFGVSAVIWTSMYVSFTPVGDLSIKGVQARYFMPLFLPFCYCLFNQRYKCRVRADIYYKILFGFVTLMNLWAIYSLALKPMNF